MPVRIRPVVLITSCFVLASGTALAQSVIVENGPATNKTIPLLSGSSVEFDVDGNLHVQCALDAGKCVPLSGTTQSVGAPTSTLTRTDSDTDVKTGESVTFNWTSVEAQACRAYTTTPSGNSSWNGVLDTSGAQSVGVSAIGTYEFSLQCFNAAGGSALQTVSVAVTENELPPPENCGITHALIQPVGFTRVNKEWKAAFTSAQGNIPTYPDSGGAPIPLAVNKGSYVSVLIQPIAGQAVSLTWEEAAPVAGYTGTQRQGDMFFSISPCPGDFRVSDATSGDPFLQNGCRKGPTRSGGLIWHTLSTPSSSGACQLVAGQSYYLNFIAADPNDGLTPGEHKCDFASSSGCDVIATQHPNN